MQHLVFKKYKNISVTVDNTQNIILLYEGIIRLLKTAKNASINNNYEERFNTIDKISQILNGLSTSLDHEKGGEIALILHQFYNFCYTRLFSIQQNNDFTVYDELENHFKIMLDGWKEAIKQQNNTNQNNLLA